MRWIVSDLFGLVFVGLTCNLVSLFLALVLASRTDGKIRFLIAGCCWTVKSIEV